MVTVDIDGVSLKADALRDTPLSETDKACSPLGVGSIRLIVIRLAHCLCVGRVSEISADNIAGVLEISIINVVIVDWPAIIVIIAILASYGVMALIRAEDNAY